MSNYLLSVDLAKTLDRERWERAEKHRMLRQLQAGRTPVLNPLGSHIRKLAMALALVLKLR